MSKSENVEKNLEENVVSNEESTATTVIPSTTSASGIVKEKKKAGKRNSMEDFIRTFQSSHSYKEVAKKLDVTISCVYTRAKNYRMQGINLKEMERANGGKMNIEAANALIEAMNSK